MIDVTDRHDPADADLVAAEATVIGREGRMLVLAPHRTAGCSTCGVAASCGTAALTRLLGTSAAPIRVVTDLDLPIGSRVRLGMREGNIIAAAALAYLVPVVAMVGAAAAAAALGTAEAGVGLAALSGLGLGYLAVRRLGSGSSLDPVLLEAPPPACDR